MENSSIYGIRDLCKRIDHGAHIVSHYFLRPLNAYSFFSILLSGCLSGDKSDFALGVCGSCTAAATTTNDFSQTILSLALAKGRNMYKYVGGMNWISARHMEGAWKAHHSSAYTIPYHTAILVHKLKHITHFTFKPQGKFAVMFLLLPPKNT